jgi:hypothetical protein
MATTNGITTRDGASTSNQKYATSTAEGGSIQLDNVAGLQAWAAGQLGYDPNSLTVTIDSGIEGVRLQAGQEVWYLVCNNSGGQIDNGKVVYASGVDTENNCLEIGLADNSNFQTSVKTLGIATHNIGDGELGLVTRFGIVRDFDTDTFDEGGLLYLGTSGNMTQTRPLFPNARILMGSVIESDLTAGKVFVERENLPRKNLTAPYGFTSTGILAGTYWKGGFYEWETLSATLALGGSVTIGQSGIAKAAHAGIVAGGVGTVTGGGQVGLQVTGVLDDERGPQTAGQTAIITEDITTLSLDEYVETTEKFSDIVTYELYIVSGSPSDASLTFNRGFSKYDDFEDNDYTIKALEVTWQGNASSSLDIALMHHKPVGWTYAASGFEAGNGDICRKSVDQSIAGDVANGLDGAYKRLDLNTYIDGFGSGHEGHLVQIITGANGTIQSMDIRVDAVSELL